MSMRQIASVIINKVVSLVWVRMKNWRKKSCKLEWRYCRRWTRNIPIVVLCMTASYFMMASHGGRFALFSLMSLKFDTELKIRF